jgi:hypothetical protein
MLSCRFVKRKKTQNSRVGLIFITPVMKERLTADFHFLWESLPSCVFTDEAFPLSLLGPFLFPHPSKRAPF